ncbi:MAG: outer membrane protein assembly factor BamE [Pseudomonadota bacterium]
MKKLLIIITCLASLALGGCSERFHLVHKIEVQQGNVITQDMVDRLEPGMTRNQVQFVMGSPIIVDVFHQDRWEYLYYLKPGYGEVTQKRISIHFDGDSLASITGTMLPSETGPDPEAAKQVTVVVPPQERIEPGLFNKIWHYLTFRKPGEDSY